jgi:hypothetical protein
VFCILVVIMIICMRYKFLPGSMGTQAGDHKWK